MPKYPFEAMLDEIQLNSDQYVDAVFSCLESEFLVMPKGVGFVEYPIFEQGYEALKKATMSFSALDPTTVLAVAIVEPISLIVLRTMLGFTPPEWGYVTTQKTGVTVTQGFVRTLDRKVRKSPETPLNPNRATDKRLKALVETACTILTGACPRLRTINCIDWKRPTPQADSTVLGALQA